LKFYSQKLFPLSIVFYATLVAPFVAFSAVNVIVVDAVNVVTAAAVALAPRNRGRGREVEGGGRGGAVKLSLREEKKGTRANFPSAATDDDDEAPRATELLFLGSASSRIIESLAAAAEAVAAAAWRHLAARQTLFSFPHLFPISSSDLYFCGFPPARGWAGGGEEERLHRRRRGGGTAVARVSGPDEKRRRRRPGANEFRSAAEVVAAAASSTDRGAMFACEGDAVRDVAVAGTFSDVRPSTRLPSRVGFSRRR
jgi:hypothetical protein